MIMFRIDNLLRAYEGSNLNDGRVKVDRIHIAVLLISYHNQEICTR